jgi:hypothetical protein
MRAIWIVVAFVALTGCGDARAASSQSLSPEAQYVEVAGSDSLGNHIDVVWGPDGGDIRTTGSDGEQDETWFRGLRWSIATSSEPWKPLEKTTTMPWSCSMTVGR